MITTKRELRKAFWEQHPQLSRKKIPNYDGTGTMHTTDTRCAWVDWIDSLEKDGQISEALSDRVEL